MKNRIREACRSITPAVLRNQMSIPPSSRALHLKRICLRTFNTIRCVCLDFTDWNIVLSCLHWLQNLAFIGWIVFFWSYLHWLNRFLILPSLAGSSSSDLIFTGWIVFWYYLHWLDRLLLILPSLAESSFDLTFTGWIVFFWSYLH